MPRSLANAIIVRCASSEGRFENSPESIVRPYASAASGNASVSSGAVVTNGNGGTGPPNRGNANQPDSETNDLPPPAGSPQEAFEKQCEQNPQACG